MLDFTPVHQGKIKLPDFVAQVGLSVQDLPVLTNEMLDTILGLIADCTDQDVVFVPSDPEADDPVAATPEELHMPWTLGHIIVHTTASAEESAYLAVELARGVAFRTGRSRYEVPWQSINTIQQCRERIKESRRMRLASLDMWPRPAHLENTFVRREGATPYNALTRFVLGLEHEAEHLEHIRQVVAQSQAARVS